MDCVITHQVINNKVVTYYKFVVGTVTMPLMPGNRVLFPSDLINRSEKMVLEQWIDTDVGKWVNDRKNDELTIHGWMDMLLGQPKYAIVATLEEKDYTFYNLKWK